MRIKIEKKYSMTGYVYEKKAILTLSKSKHYIFVKNKLGFVDSSGFFVLCDEVVIKSL